MKIIVLGFDGYIGFPLTIDLLKQGHEVFGVDNFSRRSRVKAMGSNSLTPIAHDLARIRNLNKEYDHRFKWAVINLGTSGVNYLQTILHEFQPEAIVHLAEQPSAAWSMMNPISASATQYENAIGTLHLLWVMKEECPNAHLIKIGTMGEYGTPNCDIPEGKIPEKCLGRDLPEGMYCPMSSLLFPRSPGSFYHASKVMDTVNIEFACRNWGLTSTDIMQGVVFGLNDCEDESFITRFDYDECFGTVINRFCVQSIINHPLTIYGSGNQKRGFLPLKDSIQCLNIAINNAPKEGEYRTWNQFESVYSINDLVDEVREAAYLNGIMVSFDKLENIRQEAQDHYYNPVHETLFALGYQPTTDIRSEISNLIKQILPYKERVIKEVINPKINWRR